VDKPDANRRLDRTYKLIHSLQPQALVGNNHHQMRFRARTSRCSTKDLPGQNKAGFSGAAKIGSLPLEDRRDREHSWGYQRQRSQVQEHPRLVQYRSRSW